MTSEPTVDRDEALRRAHEDRAFRLVVARLWAYEALDTKQIAERIGCDEARVYNVLQAARRMIDR